MLQRRLDTDTRYIFRVIIFIFIFLLFEYYFVRRVKRGLEGQRATTENGFFFF